MLGPEWRATVTERVIAGSTVDRLPILTFPDFPISLPSLDVQERVADALGSIDDLIESNRRRVEVLEEMARVIYRAWFVRFLYPGHENVPLVDSSLGPIPDGWAVRRIRDIAATGAGPFGSKLGRKDYVADGVPVLRGTNLRVGGGFDESDFVYLDPEKADELRSSATVRGDVLITQRGTLGQIALIPDSSDHEKYVLSQSQMKLTVSPEVASTEFVYRQMSTPETTARFIAQAMSSGVPHVNLTLLRDFEILTPPSELQHRFGGVVRDFDRQAWALRALARTLVSLRDLLLPKLVTGHIDVSHLDLDALTEAAIA
jgi:type I restriction enzyme S subunit